MSDRQALCLEDCVNETCPWSGRPVDAGSLTLYRGHVVGFCNTGCRDKFEAATALFDQKINRAEGAGPTSDSPADRNGRP